jgi:hypothetical protein
MRRGGWSGGRAHMYVSSDNNTATSSSRILSIACELASSPHRLSPTRMLGYWEAFCGFGALLVRIRIGQPELRRTSQKQQLNCDLRQRSNATRYWASQHRGFVRLTSFLSMIASAPASRACLASPMGRTPTILPSLVVP